MLPRIKDPGELRDEMLYRLLGRTGERVSAIGLGGSHIGKPAVAASCGENVSPDERRRGSSPDRKTQQVASAGEYELFKTTSHFDTTAKHLDWLGGDSPEVQALAPQSAG